MKKVILLSLILITSCVTSNSINTNLPGRLGDSEMSLKNDPRAIPAVIKVMSEFDMDGLAPEPPISIDATQLEKVDYLSSLEPVYEEVFKSWYSDLTEVEG